MRLTSLERRAATNVISGRRASFVTSDPEAGAPLVPRRPSSGPGGNPRVSQALNTFTAVDGRAAPKARAQANGDVFHLVTRGRIVN